jgi:hypothetical protein
MFRAVWAKFAAEFRRGYAESRARTHAREQPAPFAPLAHMSEEVKAVLASALRGAFAEGAQAEQARFAAFFESDEYKKPLAALIQASFNDGVLHERERIAASWAAERDTVPTESSPLETSGQSPSSLLH